MEFEKEISVSCLHENPQFLSQCAELLNKEWTRSKSARIQSLEKSFKDLPDSVLLIEEINGEKYVIGHCRLTRVLEDNNGCWIQSVVVCKERRNKGYGRLIMKKTEEYAKKLNFSTAYLNTHDKMDFYAHLGYKYCEPVSSISFRHHGLIDKGVFFKGMNEHPPSLAADAQSDSVCCNGNTNSSDNAISQTVINDIPLPPPLPQIKLLQAPTLKSNLGQYWMKKTL